MRIQKNLILVADFTASFSDTRNASARTKLWVIKHWQLILASPSAKFCLGVGGMNTIQNKSKGIKKLRQEMIYLSQSQGASIWTILIQKNQTYCG